MAAKIQDPPSSPKEFGVTLSAGNSLTSEAFWVEILPTSKRGPDELWAEKVLPEVLLGTWLGVPENCRKRSRNAKGRGAFFRQFFGTISGTTGRVPESTSGSTFSALSARSSSGAPLAGQQNLKFWGLLTSQIVSQFCRKTLDLALRQQGMPHQLGRRRLTKLISEFWGKTITRRARVPGLSAGFFCCPFSPQTQENHQKMAGNGLFFLFAKPKLRETLVIPVSSFGA